MRQQYLLTTCLVAGMSQTSASAALIHYTDKAEWVSAVGSYTTITFTELPNGTPVTNQYAHFGITFILPSFIHYTSGFVNDDFGLHGPFAVQFTLASPTYWVAIDHPGIAKFQLFQEGELVATSELFNPAGGLGNFAGLVSNVPFDEVLIFKPWPDGPNVFIDDLHWVAIPSPGAGVALLAWFAIGQRRRRR